MDVDIPAPEAKPAHHSAVADVLLGARRGIASTVYGTVVVMATLTAAYASVHDPWRLAAIVAATAFVLWIAHLYSHALSESITHDHRLTRGDFTGIAHRELGILLAAVAPCGALVLGAIGFFRERTAIWVALGIGLATLAAAGLRYAHMERLGRLGMVGAVVANVALGLFVVLLKVLVAH
jgi:hypothetical protein